MAFEITIGVFNFGENVSQYTRNNVGDVFDRVKLKLTSLNKVTKERLNNTLERLRDELLEEIKSGNKYFIQDEHTLDWMRGIRAGSAGRDEAQAHPYSRANPKPDILGHLPEAIHIQHGDHGDSPSLFDSLLPTLEDAEDKRKYQISFGDSGNLYYWRYLKYGTSKMVPRDIESVIIADHINYWFTELRREVGKAVQEVRVEKAQG
jgi:hypothetical protein